MAKFFVIASFLLFLPYGSAAVADVPGSSYNWTGFYAGLNMGGAVNDSKYTLSPSGNFLTDPTVSPTENPLRTDRAGHGGGAFTGGGQLGYNYQSGSLVFGVETDFNYDGINDSDSVNRLLQSPLIGSFVHTVTQKVDCFGRSRAPGLHSLQSIAGIRDRRFCLRGCLLDQRRFIHSRGRSLRWIVIRFSGGVDGRRRHRVRYNQVLERQGGISAGRAGKNIHLWRSV